MSRDYPTHPNGCPCSGCYHSNVTEHAEHPLREELKLAYENLTATQERCTELIQGLRACIAVRDNDLQMQLLALIVAERRRQDEKHGRVADLLTRSDVTGRAGLDDLAAVRAKIDQCERIYGEIGVPWSYILEEEFLEAIAEADEEKLRAELIQVAATALKWLEAIDLRRAQR